MFDQTTLIIVVALGMLAYAVNCAPARTHPPHSFKGWQKLFGPIAIILALLIVLSPEFLALGLLGDATFFDLLVLLLSLQLQTIAARAWHSIRPVLATLMRLMIPRNTMSFMYIRLALAPLANVVSTIQKSLNRSLA